MKKKKKGFRYYYSVIRNAIINHEKIPLFIIISFLLLCIPVCIAVGDTIQANSDLVFENADLVHTAIGDFETVSFYVRNDSEFDRPISKAVVKVLEYRADNSFQLACACVLSPEGVSVIVYNNGWTDVDNVSFQINPECDLYPNLVDPSMFSKTFTHFDHGTAYEIVNLTIDDLWDKTNTSPIVLDCTIDGESNTYQATGRYFYEPGSDRLVVGGKGGDIIPATRDCCILGENGIYEYTVPINHYCSQHGVDMIEIILTADRSCTVKYVIEFYSANKSVYTTEPYGTTFTIRSYQ